MSVLRILNFLGLAKILERVASSNIKEERERRDLALQPTLLPLRREEVL
jgi:hypothetical protein